MGNGLINGQAQKWKNNKTKENIWVYKQKNLTLKLFYVRIFVMSMLDKKKEKISALKLWLGIAVGALLAVIGFLATNLRQIEDWLIITGSFAIIALFNFAYLLNRKINRLIDDLEDL